jgi:hypothetical protein
MRTGARAARPIALVVALLVAIAAGTFALPASGAGLASGHRPGHSNGLRVGAVVVSAAGTRQHSAPTGLRHDLATAVLASTHEPTRLLSAGHTANSYTSRYSRTGFSPAVRGPPAEALA